MEAQGTGAQFKLEIHHTYPHSRDKVFDAWTNATFMKRWFAPMDEFTVDIEAVDARVGGAFAVVMTHPNGARHRAFGTYQTVDRPEKLVFTWAWSNNPAAGEMLVTLDFLERGKGTELVLTQERLVSEESKQQHSHGWTGMLARLESALG